MGLFGGGDESLNIIVKLKDEASKGLSTLQSNLQGMKKSFEPAVSASKEFAVGLTAVTGAAAALGMKALQAASDAEQAQVAFGTMLGSAEKAQSFIAEMKSFAARTPFETSDISKAAQTMLAFGISADKVMGNVQMIGDVAMGNKEKFNSLSLAFAQVQSTGRLMGQDLLQMVNQGFNPLQIISEKTGKSMSQLKDDMANGAISADMVTDAFKTATSEGGRFFGGMEAQSKTMAGMWSTLKDTINELMIEQGQKLIPMVKKVMEAFSGFITGTLPELIDKMIAAGEWLGKNQWALYAIAGAITGALLPAMGAMIAHFVMAAIALGPWMIGGAIIGGLIAGIIWIVQNWEMIKQKAIDIWTAIAGFFSNIFTQISETVTNVWNGIKNFFSAIWEGIKLVFELYLAFTVGLVMTVFEALGIDIVAVWQKISDFFVIVWEGIQAIFQFQLDAIKWLWETVWGAISTFLTPIWEGIKGIVSAGFGWIKTKFTEWSEPIKNIWKSLWEGIGAVTDTVWEGIKNSIKSSINWIIEKVNYVIDKMNEVTAKGADALGFSAPQIGRIPMLAEGGIVNKPTLAMIGEAGPEAVIPLSRMRSGEASKSSDKNITMITNIYNPIVRNDSDIENIRQQVENGISDHFRALILNHKITA